MAHERINIRQEFKLIPSWAYALAGVLFAGMVVFLLVVFRGDRDAPPIPLQILFGFLPGSIFAVVVLLVGYVTRDARRRGMNVTLWTLLVIFVPNAIGFILYFLLRHPLMIACTNCGASVEPTFNFCPRCKYNLRPACPECKRAIAPGDKFCPYCAHQLG